MTKEISERRAEPAPGVLNKLQGSTLRILEDVFQSYGEFVARHPVLVILSCVALTCVCGGGLYWFRAENEGVKLWIPYNSDYRLNNDWMFENYPRDLRFNSLIITGENILTAQVLRTMYRVSKSIRTMRNINNETWQDHCMKRPVIKVPSLFDIFGRKRREIEFDDDLFGDEFDEEKDTVITDPLELATQFSIAEYPDPYCGIVTGMPLACMELSILELFGQGGEYDERTDEVMETLTDEMVLDVINNKNVSGIFLTPYNFTSYLSNIEYDTQGEIIGAKATYIIWLGRMNMTEAKLNPAPGRGEPISMSMLQWEGDMLEVMLNKSDYPEGLESFPNVARSFGDIAGSTILGDITFFVAGYIMMFTYVQIMLGKFSCVEHRTYLSTVGILGVIMGIIVSYGICSAAGHFYGPMHSVMPFLMLGIGIDDMFVIIQCWDTLSEEEKKENLVKRFGFLMKQAGAAITVTSATDVIAFGVGAFTILPALQSFCIYAAVGIVATFVFQSSFFLAWMNLDQRRIESNRNGCCPCYVHPETNNQTQERKGVLQRVFKRYAEYLIKTPVKISVLLVALVITGFGVYGNVLLRQEFDPTWFLPQDTYIAQWFVNNKMYFPSSGERGTIYFSGTELPADIDKIEKLSQDLRKQTDIIVKSEAWTRPYIDYLQKLNYTEEPNKLNKTAFRSSLSQFLFSPAGAVYRNGFNFKEELECGELASEVKLSEITYTHRLMNGPEEHVPAMNRVKDIIESANISGKVFAMALGYATWETDEIISLEIYRNMALAIVCVFITTLFFISNLGGSFLILLCVCLTLVDVGGFMHFWGLTIDTVSCNNLIIAIGLCVDYSAHVMHRFLTEQGPREDRVVQTVSNIGPAVFNGGVSTFLAFVLLATSRSHVFSSFFKIFFLVVSFGLFHGLVLLPVILSFIGPGSAHYTPVARTDIELQSKEKENPGEIVL